MNDTAAGTTNWRSVAELMIWFAQETDRGPIGDAGESTRFEIEYSDGFWSVSYWEPGGRHGNGRHGNASARYDEGLHAALDEARERVTSAPDRQRAEDFGRLAMSLSMFLGSAWSLDQAKAALAALDTLKPEWAASGRARPALLAALRERLAEVEKTHEQARRMATPWSPPEGPR